MYKYVCTQNECEQSPEFTSFEPYRESEPPASTDASTPNGHNNYEIMSIIMMTAR